MKKHNSKNTPTATNPNEILNKAKIIISRHLLHLPEDQFRNVIEYLFLKDILTLTTLSKETRILVYQSIHILSNAKPTLSTPPPTHLQHNNNNNNNSEENITRGLSILLHRFENVRYLILWNLSDAVESLIPIINRTAPKLVTLEFHGCRITHHSTSISDWSNSTNNNLSKLVLSGLIYIPYKHNTFLQSFITNSSHILKHIELDGCRKLNDKDVSNILSQVTCLESLKVSNCSIFSPRIQSQTITNLDMSNCSCTLQKFQIFNCPLLVYCNLSNNGRLRGKSVKQVLDNCPKLQILLLSHCYEVKFIRVLHMRELQVLDLTVCFGLEELEIVGDNELIDLKIQQCCSLQSLRIESNSHAFKELTIQNLPLLTNLQISANSLLSLDISGCKLLSDDTTYITCPNLQLLDICCTCLSNDFYKIMEDLEACFVKRGILESSISRFLHYSM